MTLPSLSDYQTANSRVKPFTGADKVKYVDDRFIGCGYAGMPASVNPADRYLQRFGHNIGVDKVLRLAVTAEQHGFHTLSESFWIAAYQMAYKNPPPASPQPTAAPVTAPVKPAPSNPTWPVNLQPGQVATMQPTDAKLDASAYIADVRYSAQPKRDGWRTLVFARDSHAITQTRELNTGVLITSLGTAFQAAAHQFGPFIADGELYWMDVQGNEHMNAATAGAANAELGQPAAILEPHYALFDMLFADAKDLRQWPFDQRAAQVERIGSWLYELEPAITWLPPQLTTADKQALFGRQQAEGREGVIFRLNHAAYHGGKVSRQPEPIVRVKFTQQLTVRVSALKLGGAPGAPFGALEVADLVTGADLGAVGAGFSADDKVELACRFATGEPLNIHVTTRGTTPYGKLRHATFDSIAN